MLATVAALAAGGSDVLARTADVGVPGSAIAIFCAGVLFYFQWHAGADRTVAWLVIVAAAVSLQQLNWFLLVHGDPAPAGTTWVYALQVLFTLALGAVLVHGDRLHVPTDPLAIGLLLGLAMILFRFVVLKVPTPALDTTGYVVALAALGAAGLWNAGLLLRSRVLTSGLRRDIAISWVLLTVGLITAVPGAPEALLVLSALANTAGSALIVATAFIYARLSIIDEAAAVRLLCDRLEAARYDLHSRQAQLHEVRATIAGISSATELQRREEISPQRRQQLHEMTLSELRRLHRLVGDASRRAPEPTELDATLRPIVLRHEAQGLQVEWHPSGHVGLARADDVAEIVNVLLSNAARHARGSQVRLEVCAIEGEVQVSVADRGPGVDPDTRSRLFTWGGRSAASPGLGVGLASARILAEELGGRLVLDESAIGARFVLALPAPSALRTIAPVAPASPLAAQDAGR